MTAWLQKLHINLPERRFPTHDTRKKLTINAGAPVPDEQNVS